MSATRGKLLSFWICLLMCLTTLPSIGQQRTDKNIPLQRILFILDASNSMNGRWESGTKMTVATKLLSELMDSLQGAPNLELALRVYGHQHSFLPVQNCEDTKLEIPFAKDNQTKIISKMKLIRPKGTTPIAQTLEKVAGDFPSCTNCRNVVILITDGIEECDGDPCKISQALQSQGIIVKPFVIGIGLDPMFMETFSCVGKYFDASNEKVFKQVIGAVISQAMNTTTAQINLLNKYGQPKETDVTVSLTDYHTGGTWRTMTHTMNHKGLPDTINLDPIPTYNMKVHTLPPVEVDSIELTPSIHNIIAAETPQGWLNVKYRTQARDKGVKVIVRQKSQMQTLNVQEMGYKHKYLMGSYDLEILTLPRTYFYGVKVDQSTTTTLELDPPGNVTIMSSTQGVGQVFQMKDNEMLWVCNLNDRSTKEILTLMPGSYKVVFRPHNSGDTNYTIEQNFEVKSNMSQQVRLF